MKLYLDNKLRIFLQLGLQIKKCITSRKLYMKKPGKENKAKRFRIRITLPVIIIILVALLIALGLFNWWKG